jgi:hypothetical protein
MNMKGQTGGGISIFNVLLFYVVFLLVIGYLGTLAGITIVTVSGNPANIPIPTDPLDILSLFNFFISLMSTNSTYQLVAVIFVTPFLILLGYGILQLIRGTG